MYIDYWQLKEKPFENVLSFKYISATPSQEECLTRLYYAVTDRKSGAVLTGPAGSGKTMIREQLIKKIKTGRKGKRHFCSIVHPTLGIEEIIHECFAQLGVEKCPPSKPQLLRQFGNKLLELAEKGEEAVLVFDDAHMMSVEALGELKLLLNLHDYSQRLLFTTILIGESDDGGSDGLVAKLAKVPGLRQRLNLIVPMHPMTREETGQYIQRRLDVAGGKKPIFQEDAVDAIYRFSKGNPRETNNACDLALLIGFGDRVPSVDAALVRRVISEMSGPS